MGNFLQNILTITFAIAAVFVAATLDFLPQWPVTIYFLAYLAIAAAFVLLPFTQDMASHREWLKKRDKQTHRDTEILVPPKGLKELSRLLDNGKKNEINTFVKNYSFKAFWRVSLVFFLLILVLSSSVSLQFNIGFIGLEYLVKILDEEQSLAPISSLNTLSFGVFIAFVMGFMADTARQATIQNIQLILNKPVKKSLVRRYGLTVFTAVVGLGLFAAFALHGAYKVQQSETEQTVQALASKTENLQSAQEQLAEKKDFLAKENAQLNKTLQEKQSRIGSLEKELKSLKGKLSVQKNEVETLTQQFNAAQEDLKSLRKELENVQDTKNAGLEEMLAEVSALKEQLSEKQNELSASRERLEITEGALEVTQKELSDAQAALDKWQAPVSLAEQQWGEKVDVVWGGTTLRVQSADLFVPQQPDKLKADISSVITPIAEGLKSVLQANENSWVVIQAHSNALPPQTGAYNNNLILTAIQATRLKELLNEAGVKPVLAAGFGHQRELDSRLVEEALKKNNRVEFTVVRLPLKK